jgi:hypothetical protein
MGDHLDRLADAIERLTRRFDELEIDAAKRVDLDDVD